MDQPTKYFAIYVRVSSMEQATSKEGSLVSQEQRCREFIQYQYGDVPIVLYQESGRSGRNTNRPEFRRLVAHLRAGRIKAVCFTEISRVSRSLIDFTEFHNLCKGYEVHVISLREKFDTSTAAGNLMINILASWAQYESEQISERTSLNFEARSKRGLYNGGYCYGYRPCEGRRGYLNIDEEEANVINLIYDKYLELGSYCEVTKWLNNCGYRTRQYITKSGKTKLAARWNKNTIINILRNEMYIGKSRLKDGKIVQGVWRPIVDETKWNEVQELLKKNYQARGNTIAVYKHTYLFGGLIRCTHCDTMLESGSGTGKKGKKTYYYYRHVNGKRLPTCPHPYSIPAEQIENFLCQPLLQSLNNQQFVELVTKEFNKLVQDQQKIVQQQQEQIKRQIQAIHTESSQIVQKLPLLPEDQILEFVVPRLEALKNQKRELEDRQKQLELEMIDVTGEMLGVVDIQKSFEYLVNNFWLMTVTERKELIGIVVDRIDMNQDRFVMWFRVSSESSADTLTDRRFVVSNRTFPFPMPFIFDRKGYKLILNHQILESN